MASQDWPEVTKYAGLVCAQAHRQELIQDLFKTWQDPVRGTVSGGMIKYDRASPPPLSLSLSLSLSTRFGYRWLKPWLGSRILQDGQDFVHICFVLISQRSFCGVLV